MNDFEIPEKFCGKDVIDILGNGKVLKYIVKEGDGSESRATKGTTATIHYIGTLLNGEKFDSSRDRSTPFETEVGAGKVIKGWDAVMPTMAKGERAEVLIAPDYAYGEHGSPPKIPGNSHLIFDMEMLSWFGFDISAEGDKSLTKIILKEAEKPAKKIKTAEKIENGSGDAEKEEDAEEAEESESGDNDEGFESDDLPQPREATQVKINILNKENGEWTKDFWYTLGEELLYPEVLNEHCKMCIFSMKLGEKSEFTINKNEKIWIELLEFDNGKETFDMTGEEQMEFSQNLKDRAGELFKQGHLKVALAKYQYIKESLAAFEQRKDADKESEEDKIKLEEEHKNLKVAVLSNDALINLKLKQASEAKLSCEEVLELDEKNEKATFRIAQAYQLMGSTDEAIAWYTKVLDINANNKAAKSGVVQAKKLKKQLFEAEKKKYSKMFG